MLCGSLAISKPVVLRSLIDTDESFKNNSCIEIREGLCAPPNDRNPANIQGEAKTMGRAIHLATM